MIFVFPFQTGRINDCRGTLIYCRIDDGDGTLCGFGNTTRRRSAFTRFTEIQRHSNVRSTLLACRTIIVILVIFSRFLASLRRQKRLTPYRLRSIDDHDFVSIRQTSLFLENTPRHSILVLVHPQIFQPTNRSYSTTANGTNEIFINLPFLPLISPPHFIYLFVRIWNEKWLRGHIMSQLSMQHRSLRGSESRFLWRKRTGGRIRWSQ
ncbi:hypothetical protein BDQ17DRAFT_1357534 [Cyathus striatus]|nr:hypothetical protein BDQ17DRAFT_1357534 [Cyathus striatus]